ncbi:MAG: rnhA operon protein [Halodesulfurarchaeum sp.]|nr:rnhA operon protein [Halodesulfurarchaeum sp.]
MPDLPDSVFETVRAMTRTIRRETHSDPVAIRERRDTLLDRYGYAARVREDQSDPVLVCYPDHWLADGTFQPEHLESTENAVEGPLYSLPQGDSWAAIEAHNEALAERVAEQFGETHGANAAAFGTYMANHHAARIEAATSVEIEDFLAEYFPRNAWPSGTEAAAVETSLERVFAVAGEPFPLERDG